MVVRSKPYLEIQDHYSCTCNLKLSYITMATQGYKQDTGTDVISE